MDWGESLPDSHELVSLVLNEEIMTMLVEKGLYEIGPNGGYGLTDQGWLAAVPVMTSIAKESVALLADDHPSSAALLDGELRKLIQNFVPLVAAKAMAERTRSTGD